MKILFATDGSKAALSALESLLARYDWFRDPPQLTLLNVHPPIPYGMAARWVGKQTVDDYCAEESATALASSKALLDTRGIVCATEARIGDPAREVVTVAREGRHDLVAMGTHGQTALAQLMLGSVAQKVVTMAQVPVLLLK
jgi:nucleotide-binding universal stress UspA family protein